MSRLRLFSLVASVAVCCEAPSQPVEQRAEFTIPQASLTAEQRSTTSVPGSDDKLKLTIDDITRGQVIASLSREDGTLVLSPTSMQSGDARPFSVENGKYQLTLVALSNELIGDDTAEFRITSPASMSESQKIEKLISVVEQLGGAKFIRNGEEYEPREAANHLRRKMDAVGDKITTADAFIDHVGARSSSTGEPYQIRMADGMVTDAETFLRAKLGEIGKQSSKE